MLVNRVVRSWQMNALAVRANRQFGSYFGKKLVAWRIPPKHKVVRCHFRVGNICVVRDARIPTKLPPPMGDGVIHLCLCPRANFFVHRLAGRTHHKEGVHERIVYWTLKPVLFMQREVVFGIGYGPFGAAFSKMSSPGAVRHHRRGLETWEEHTSSAQSRGPTSHALFCL